MGASSSSSSKINIYKSYFDQIPKSSATLNRCTAEQTPEYVDAQIKTAMKQLASEIETVISLTIIRKVDNIVDMTTPIINVSPYITRQDLGCINTWLGEKGWRMIFTETGFFLKSLCDYVLKDGNVVCYRPFHF